MTAASKRPGVNNKPQPKRPGYKRVLTAPVNAQWPSISVAQARLIKQTLREAADGLTDRKRLQPPWRELRKVPKDKRAEAIKNFKEQHLADLDILGQEAFLEIEKTKKAKLAEIVFGYNEVMRHLSRGTLAAVLVNKAATPEFLAKSFLPGCYCRSIPVAAIENLEEVFGKCIAVGFKESVKEEGSAFHALYNLMVDATDDSALTLPTTSHESNAPSPATGKHSKRLMKKKVAPPVVDVSRFHLIRGSPEQVAFFSKLSGKQWSFDVISLSSDIPDNAKGCTSFDFRKKKQFRKLARDDSSTVLGEGDVTDSLKSPRAPNFADECSDVMFEIDFCGDNESTADELVSQETSQEATEEKFAESPNRKSSIVQRSDLATEDQRLGQKTKTLKRKAREVEQKLTGASSYVPATVARVAGNPKRKKLNKK